MINWASYVIACFFSSVKTLTESRRLFFLDFWKDLKNKDHVKKACLDLLKWGSVFN